MQIQAKSKIEVLLQEIVFSNGATVSLFFMISETEEEPSIKWVVASNRILEFYNDSESAQEAVKRKCGELALSGYVIETNTIHGVLKGSYGKHINNKHGASTVKHAKVSKNVEINVSPSYLKTGQTLKLDKIEET